MENPVSNINGENLLKIIHEGNISCTEPCTLLLVGHSTVSTAITSCQANYVGLGEIQIQTEFSNFNGLNTNLTGLSNCGLVQGSGLFPIVENNTTNMVFTTQQQAQNSSPIPDLNEAQNISPLSIPRILIPIIDLSSPRDSPGKRDNPIPISSPLTLLIEPSRCDYYEYEEKVTIQPNQVQPGTTQDGSKVVIEPEIEEEPFEEFFGEEEPSEEELCKEDP